MSQVNWYERSMTVFFSDRFCAQFRRIAGVLDVSSIVVEQQFAQSSDGTRVPVCFV
jgi:prolyl oligopeptidase PreP (S9A serine peptidase family)